MITYIYYRYGSGIGARQPMAFGWGLVGIWAGLACFMLLRPAAVLGRLRSGRWAVVGAVR